jgi:hypothetical protein
MREPRLASVGRVILQPSRYHRAAAWSHRRRMGEGPVADREVSAVLGSRSQCSLTGSIQRFGPPESFGRVTADVRHDILTFPPRCAFWNARPRRFPAWQN